MKKNVVTLILTMVLLTACSVSKIVDYKETNDYKKLLENKDSITSLIIKKDTEGGRTCYKIDGDLMNEVYDMLTNIQIRRETSIVSNDNDEFYTWTLDDDTKIDFSFNNGNFVYNEKIYVVSNYVSQTSTHLEKYIIDCE